MGLQDYESINALSLEMIEEYGYGTPLTGIARCVQEMHVRFQGDIKRRLTCMKRFLRRENGVVT